jgi:hypothetical protein
MDLGGQTSSGTPQSLVAAPFYGPWPPAGALVRWSSRSSGTDSSCGHQVCKDALPYSGPRPAHEPRMHTLVLAVTLGKIMPACSGTQHPQHTIDELTIIRCRPPPRAPPAQEACP